MNREWAAEEARLWQDIYTTPVIDRHLYHVAKTGSGHAAKVARLTILFLRDQAYRSQWKAYHDLIAHKPPS